MPDRANVFTSRTSFEGSDYESLIDGNAWSPSAYPAGWLKL